MEKTMKALGRDGRPPARDSKPLPVEFEVGVLNDYRYVGFTAQLFAHYCTGYLKTV
jgi:hypothetical protein